MFFAIPNLTSTQASPCIPWEWNRRDLVPPGAFSDKSERTKWLQNPDTNYQCYSAFQGVNAGLRLKGPNSADEGNPPVSMAALCADYDLRLTESEIDAGLARMPIKPNWIETTLSGNSRLVFLFESPIALPSYSFAVFLLQKIVDFLPVRQLAGLDEPALFDPTKFFTNGGVWKPISTAPVSGDLLRAFLIDISPKFEWDAPEFGPTVPLDVAAAELRKKFTRFAEWPGAFSLGAQGPSFWISGSVSPLSAIVRETGLQTFSAHSPKPYFSWSELIGAEFVQQFKAKQIGSAVENIFFDEKSYFLKLPDGSWGCDPRENIALFLKVTRGLSDRTRKGEHVSEVETAMAYIQRNKRVKGAASFAFYKEGLIDFNGTRCLNLHTKKAIAPAPGPAEWGETGSFPFLSKFLDTLFSPAEQLPHFLSWTAYFYRNCYYREPRSGHALFIAGGTSVGKTFLNRAVIGGLVGGFAEANSFLGSSDAFNSEMFDFAHWVLDDGSISVDLKSHKKFSEMVKRAVANPSFRWNGKFLKAGTVKWQGRVCVTLNTDGESLRMLPDLELSLKEKVMLLRTVPEAAVQFLSQSQMDDILVRELPHLARFLLDYEYPPHTLHKDPRLFVNPYHEDTLVSSANHSSSSSAFAEILEEFLKEFFQQNPDADAWTGTGLALCKQILSDPAMVPLMRSYNSATIGRIMSVLAGKGVFDIKIGSEDFSRGFVISRGARYPKKHVNGSRVPQAENSHFERK